MSTAETPRAAAPSPGPAETLLLAENFADRRRLRRLLSKWRIIALVAIVSFLLAVFWRTTGDTAPATASPHIARVDITGVIGNDEDLLATLETIAERDTVEAVIVHIDSPGGTAVGGEAHYFALREIAEAKPLVAQVETLAASAGYMIATAADHIVARNTSIVGSIGVIVTAPNVSELLDRVGVEVREIKSTPLKAEPSPFNEVEPQDVAMMRAMVLDSYEWFAALVAERRGYEADALAAVADGSVFSGRQSLENGLVDAIGGEEAVMAHLASRDIDTDLPVIRYEPPSDESFLGGLLGQAGTGLLDGLGLGNTFERTRARIVPLDGMLALWQGPAR